MRAVNLIPTDSRRGGSAGSDIGAYAVLGGLAVLLLGVTLYVLSANQIADRKGELAQSKRNSASVTARLAALAPYQSFATMEQSRVSTVKQLAATRFDWDRTMQDLSRVLGKHVWLQSMQGTVSPTVALDGGDSGDGSTFRAASPDPAVVLQGCATSNKEVIAFVSRLRAMKGVTRVTLADAAKADTTSDSGSASSSGDSAAGSSGCGSDRWPQFNLVAFYDELPAAPTASTGTAQTASATGTAPAAGTSTTPAATTPATTTPAGG